MHVATEELFFCYAFLLLLNWSWSYIFGLGLNILVLFPSLPTTTIKTAQCSVTTVYKCGTQYSTERFW